ncbi:MAG: hypothetical protein HY652_04210 [Acidobacteria bacterium]|nr:hypothetical protein [Acidobacteriota bacterium]
MRDRARFFFRGMLALELGDLEFFPESKSLIALYRATWPIRVTGMYGLAAVQRLSRVVGRRRLSRGGG